MRIEKHESEDDLILDLYFPEILTGIYGDPDQPAETLRRLKEVDGPGSGLDADLLDGLHAGSFLLRDAALEGRMAVVMADGGLGDGGSFGEFCSEFSNNTSELFR